MPAVEFSRYQILLSWSERGRGETGLGRGQQNTKVSRRADLWPKNTQLTSSSASYAFLPPSWHPSHIWLLPPSRGGRRVEDGPGMGGGARRVGEKDKGGMEREGRSGAVVWRVVSAASLATLLAPLPYPAHLPPFCHSHSLRTQGLQPFYQSDPSLCPFHSYLCLAILASVKVT